MGIFRARGKVYKPVADVDLGPNSGEDYVEADVKAPRLAGFLVKIFAWVLESRILGPIVLYILKKDNRIHKFVTFADISEAPRFTPTHSWQDPKEHDVVYVKPGLSPPQRTHEATKCIDVVGSETTVSTAKFRRRTVMDFSRAYSSREISPLEVAKRFLRAVDASSDPGIKMSFFINYSADDILRQAAESTQRYESGNPISVLDGVLIAVKDEIDCLPYPTTGGTKWLHKHRHCTKDADSVRNLRSCGAILVGKTNMHEIGAGTSGINPHYGVCRNPYDPSKISGGSSSGSAAAVCAGLCPVALGVDGGGSVRMPASLCGVIGLKPTTGRVSHDGILPLNWTVGCLGILSATVEDAMIVYAALGDQLSPKSPTTLQPELNLPLLTATKEISGFKLAKYGKWFNDSNDEVRNCCDRALDLFCGHYGWEVVDVTVPEIEEMRLAHYTTIGSECTTSLATYLDNLDFAEIGWDVRVALQVYGSFHSRDYINAQKMRNRQMYFHNEIFKRADVIVTPTTGVTAYEIQDDTFQTGELDYVNGAALVRYSIAGNFLGLPAVTVMVGYDKRGLPVGLQFIGKPWSEATLLHLAYAMQELCIKEYRTPKVFFDLLKNKGQ